MALSGTFTGTIVNGHYTVRVAWSAAQDVMANTSEITVNCYLDLDWSLSVGTRTVTVTIDGVQKTFTAPAISYSSSSGPQSILLGSTSNTVNHNTDGTKTIAISAVYPINATISGTHYASITATQSGIALNQIDRTAPVITFSATPSVNTIGLVIDSSVMSDSWAYSVNGGAWQVAVPGGSGLSWGMDISGLLPNTVYQIRARARKTVNGVYGTSAQLPIKTLGAAQLVVGSVVCTPDATANLSFSLIAYDTSYTHTLTILQGSSTLVTVTGITVPVTGSQVKTISLLAVQRSAIMNAMPSAASAAFTFKLSTYGGATLIGTSEISGNAVLSAAYSGPSFSNAAGWTYQDSNSTVVSNISGSNQQLVQTISTLAITAYSGNAQNGATISRYEVSALGKVVASSSTSLAYGSIAGAGSVDFIVRVYDSRGFSAVVTKTLTVWAWANAVAVTESVKRVNGVEANVVCQLAGTYAVIGNNAFYGIQYRYKQTSSGTWGSWTAFNSNYWSASAGAWSLDNTLGPISLNVDNSYNLEIRYADKMQLWVVEAFIIPKGTPLVTFKNNKVGILNPDPQFALDITGFQAWHSGNDGAGSGLDADKLDGREGLYYMRCGDIIQNGDNLNSFTILGNYRCTSDATAATLINSPTAKAFTLTVEGHVGVKQTITEYLPSSVAKTFTRNWVSYNDTWGSWYLVWDDRTVTAAKILALISSKTTQTLTFGSQATIQVQISKIGTQVVARLVPIAFAWPATTTLQATETLAAAWRPAANFNVMFYGRETLNGAVAGITLSITTAGAVSITGNGAATASRTWNCDGFYYESAT